MSTDQNQGSLVEKKHAIQGRKTPVIRPTFTHLVKGTPLNLSPQNEDEAVAVFAMGCFWGVERLFWEQHGVLSTAAVYCGGYTENPTYKEVCTGKTAHAEGVRIVFDQSILPYTELLSLFWNSHDPTQGMRQKNDVGSQYRSAIFYTSQAQHNEAVASMKNYQALLDSKGHKTITTVIAPLESLYFAEEEHQQYLYKNPNGYCSIGGIDLENE